MTVILNVMPEGTSRRMMTPELERELAAIGSVTVCHNARELSEEAYGALWEQADAVLSGWGFRPPTPAMLDRSNNLKVISHTAGSVRMLPRYALEKGIVVTSARSAIARTVAEFCLMNALVLLRRLPIYIDSAPKRAAFFAADLAVGQDKPLAQTLFSKTVGLIGYGYVARHFRTLLQPFGCRILVYDPFISAEEARANNIETVSLPFLLQNALIVSLHAPDIPATRHMIGAHELDMLCDGAILLNSARGRLLDTEALTAALQTKRFYAALDVSDPEPLPLDHPLRSLPNVLFTPHIAGPTEDDLPTLTRTAITDMRHVLNGEPPVYPISLAAYDIMSF